MKKLRLALAQMNPTVGDLAGNADRIIKLIRKARRSGAHLVALPELALTGYPPEDLLLKSKFISDNRRELRRVTEATRGITAIVGFVDKDKKGIYNAAAIMHGSKLVDIYHKVHLPNYGVFDEQRYFTAGSRSPVYNMGGLRFGVNICEDIWYPDGPAESQAKAGAGLLICINASPYSTDKFEARRTMLRERATRSSLSVAYLNMVGGQDEVVFDGASLIVSPRGATMAQAAQFSEELLIADLPIKESRSTGKQAITVTNSIRPPSTAKLSRPEKRIAEKTCYEEEVYGALKLGLRDYLAKNGFTRAVIGLSGGIDSALVAAIAADTLGPRKVHCLFMPSRYSSNISLKDSTRLAENLDLKFDVVNIDGLYESYLHTLAPLFRRVPADVTEENIQARIRGNLLMALSNKTGAIVLATGNKSEMSVGYATLYGDMAGGFALIKDIPKMLVYSLARWRNRQGPKGSPAIPRRIITRAPSAELREGQRDCDSLPPYDVLDPILQAYIEDNMSVSQIVRAGLGDRATVKRVAWLVDINEHKRRQAPPGVKITARALGKDRRMPITNSYRAR